MKRSIRSLFIILCVLLLVIVISPVVMANIMGPGMMNGMMGGMMGGAAQLSGWSWGLMIALATLRVIAVVGALVVGTLLLVRTLSDPARRAAGAGPTAIELLQRRYAAGEISAAEYEQMRQVLAH